MQHHVYFWLKEEFKTEENISSFEKGLSRLVMLDQVIRGGYGKPAGTEQREVSESSYDYCLYLSFDNLDKHDAYQVHPKHDEFLEDFKEQWERVMVMDTQ